MRNAKTLYKNATQRVSRVDGKIYAEVALGTDRQGQNIWMDAPAESVPEILMLCILQLQETIDQKEEARRIEAEPDLARSPWARPPGR